MKNTQADMILSYLKENGSITPKDAYREFDCLRLAAQIYILKSRGVKIKSTLETSRNRYGRKTCYSRYFLAEGVRSNV